MVIMGLEKRQKDRKKKNFPIFHDFSRISCKVKTYHEFMSTVITAKEKSNANEA